MTAKKKATLGRPKTGTKIARSVGFDSDKFAQIEAIARQSGKSFAKIVQEGGDLIVEHYRKKGFDV